MSKVVFDMSMSLDGYVTGPNPRPEEGLGDGGERLHEWAFGDDERNRRLLADAVGELGAVIAGRDTYDLSIPWWGADGPTGPERRPVIVLTHQAPEESPANGVYTFVTDGVESALEKARAVAGDRVVTIMGGPNVGRQFVAAGLVDEISVHLVPAFLGNGIRMFDGLGGGVDLEPVGVIDTSAATHLRFRVIKSDRA